MSQITAHMPSSPYSGRAPSNPSPISDGRAAQAREHSRDHFQPQSLNLDLQFELGPNGTLLCKDKDDLDLGPEPWNSEVFHLQGIPREHDLPPSLREQWKNQLKVSPREFFKTLFEGDKVRPGETSLCVERADGEIRALDLEIDLDCPRSGRNIGRLDRLLSFPENGPPKVYHRLFDLDRDAQGQGISKEILANSVKLYDQAGITRVDLMAAMAVGGYAWAKYGFTPKEGHETRQLFATVRERLSRFKDVPSGVRGVIKRLLDQGDAKAIWAISDLDGVKVRRGDKEVSLGKALLLGTVWKGTLRLDDPEARARFDQYVFRNESNQGAAR